MNRLWLFFTFVSMLALGFNDNLRGPLFFELLKEFQLTDLQGAWFFSASSLFGFFASLGSAYFLKRFHLLQLLQLSLFVMSASLFGIGFFQNYLLCLLAAGFFGVSMGFMSVAQNSTIPFLTSPEKQSPVFSGLHSMYGLSSFLAPVAVGWGLVRDWVWRDFFQVSAGVVFLVFLGTLVSSYPQWAREHRTVEQPQKNTIRGLGILSVYMSLTLSFYVIAEILIGTRLSLYIIREFELNTEEASRYVTGFYLGLLGGRLFGIFIQWPGPIRNQLFVSLVLSFLTILGGLHFNPWLFALCGLTMSPFYPVFMTYLSEIYQKRIGTMMSLTIAVQSLSIVLMHQIVGFVSDLVGIKVAMHLGLLFALLSLLFLWRGEIERRRQA